MIAKFKPVWKIVDAKDQIFGRFCSQLAKLALLGEKIVIINAKDAAITGRRNWILAKYVHLREIGDNSNPLHGPFHNNRPDTFMRQKIRFMLPKNARGKDALARVHVYISGIPAAKANLYQKAEMITVPNASIDRLAHKFVTVMDICDNMGYTRVRGTPNVVDVLKGEK